jgi:hypothetical protein
MSADRQRRYRQRKAAQLRRVPVTVSQDVVDALVVSGGLRQWDEGDPQAIGRAIELLLGMIVSEDRDA